MNIILFGSPGSGKGTQALLLADFLGIRKISLGDILREEVKKGSNLGKEVKSYMERGALVSDGLVSRVVEENIDKTGFLLDGYPRNLNQAEKLDEILNKNNSDIDSVIYLDINEQTIVNRLSKRQRSDDDPEVIKSRWQVFSQQADKILNFYQKKNKLIKIDGRGEIKQVFERIKKELQCRNL